MKVNMDKRGIGLKDTPYRIWLYHRDSDEYEYIFVQSTATAKIVIKALIESSYITMLDIDAFGVELRKDMQWQEWIDLGGRDITEILEQEW